MCLRFLPHYIVAEVRPSSLDSDFLAQLALVKVRTFDVLFGNFYTHRLFPRSQSSAQKLNQSAKLVVVLCCWQSNSVLYRSFSKAWLFDGQEQQDTSLAHYKGGVMHLKKIIFSSRLFYFSGSANHRHQCLWRFFLLWFAFDLVSPFFHFLNVLFLLEVPLHAL